MDMSFTIWPVMYGSGATTGMIRTTTITARQARPAARLVLFAAAVGAAMRTTAASRADTAPGQALDSASADFVLSCPIRAASSNGPRPLHEHFSMQGGLRQIEFAGAYPMRIRFSDVRLPDYTHGSGI